VNPFQQAQRWPAAVPQLHDYLHATAARLPDKVALVCDGQRLTYAELEASSNALAHALVRRGVRRGDRVVIFADNTVQTVITFWGALKANAVTAIVNSQVKTDKLASLLNDCRAAALVTDARHTAIFAEAAARSAHLKATLIAGPRDESRTAHLPGVVDWDEALAAEPRDTAPPRLNLDIDLAAIVYSSGTTGTPKAIMLTHRNMLAAATSISTYLENVEDDVILNVLPLALTYGLYQLITSVKAGARLVLMRSFSYPAQVLEQLVEEGVTGLPGVPTMYAILGEMKTLRDYDLSKLRYVTNAAAALPVKYIRMLRELLPGAKLYSMYGQTECARGAYLPPEDVDRKPDSIGIAPPNMEFWLVDENDEKIGPGQIGQLVIRSAMVMKGYWEKPEATAERLRPGPLPGETVLYTGDYGRFDEDGYLYFVSRMDDIIKSRGEKVSPREVENVLVDIPGVREAAVIGVPDPILGQAVKAFVILDQGATLTEKAVQIECGKRLETFLVPKAVVFVSDLPRTSGGKIKKTDLR
jgi:acyl-CoA synthetase (AMP-forming)/AMP-acid ligase II